jgi:hypothetical protein
MYSTVLGLDIESGSPKQQKEDLVAKSSQIIFVVLVVYFLTEISPDKLDLAYCDYLGFGRSIALGGARRNSDSGTGFKIFQGSRTLLEQSGIGRHVSGDRFAGKAGPGEFVIGQGAASHHYRGVSAARAEATRAKSPAKATLLSLALSLPLLPLATLGKGAGIYGGQAASVINSVAALIPGDQHNTIATGHFAKFVGGYFHTLGNPGVTDPIFLAGPLRIFHR